MNINPLKFAIIFTASIALLSGCAVIDQIKGDVTKSAENVTKKTEEVKNQLMETRENIDRKIQKAENVVNAVGELQAELKK